MDIKNKRICIVVALNCPYGGNIIPSLKALANILKNEYNVTVCWIFPEQPEREWLKELQESYDVSFTKSSYSKTASEFKIVFNKWKPDLVHTHYEAYDIAVAKSVDRKTRMIWHIHDHMSLDVAGQTLGWIRKLRRSIHFSIHYGFYGRKANLLAVSNEMAAFCGYYKTRFFLFPPIYTNEELEYIKISDTETLINGVDCSRLAMLPDFPCWRKTDPFTFLSYGGQNTHKRVDFLVQAGICLASKKLNFRILITKGADTELIVKSVVGEILPDWLVLVEQTDNIINLLVRSACYVSTSVHETMSTAIAEATLYGLPVIQSDIPGTYWNAKNPSTFLFKKGDVRDLAEKMEMLMRMDYDGLKDLCTMTKEINMERLSLETWCRKVISCYQNL